MKKPDERDALEHPMQPVGADSEGVVRFKPNAIVRYLLDTGPLDMNALAVLPNISDEDHAQFAQLIGYSVAGLGELSYVSDELYDRAVKAQRARKGKKKFVVVHRETRQYATEVWTVNKHGAIRHVEGQVNCFGVDEADRDAHHRD